MQFGDEATPIRKFKYSPLLVWVVIYLIVPLSSVVLIIIKVTNMAWRKYNERKSTKD
jgi:hypothetical protein